LLAPCCPAALTFANSSAMRWVARETFREPTLLRAHECERIGVTRACGWNRRCDDRHRGETERHDRQRQRQRIERLDVVEQGIEPTDTHHGHEAAEDSTRRDDAGTLP